MRVLVACEESQEVCKAFRALGHEAFSCDILPCSGGHPEWHIQGDVLDFLDLNPWNNFQGWDLMIAHPPCTYLSNAAAVRLFPKKVLNTERYAKGLLAKDFFMALLNANIPLVAVENPVPSRIFQLPPYTQIIQPYHHGHPYSKKTCLWLKGLSPLRPTKIISENVNPWVDGGSKGSKGEPRKKRGAGFRDPVIRSKTFPGIAKAMAEQWGGIVK